MSGRPCMQYRLTRDENNRQPNEKIQSRPRERKKGSTVMMQPGGLTKHTGLYRVPPRCPPIFPPSLAIFPANRPIQRNYRQDRRPPSPRIHSRRLHRLPSSHPNHPRPRSCDGDTWATF